MDNKNRIKLNDFPVNLYEINGCTFFKYREVIYCYLLKIPCTKELLKISESNIYRKTNKGRYSCSYINADGLVEWINHSLRFTPREKAKYIKELIELKLVSENTQSATTTKELTFFSLLTDILNQIGITDIKRQYNIDDYLVDCIINNSLVIEFNENNHIGYDKEEEEKRYNIIKQKGYEIISVLDDKKNLGVYIGNILKKII